MMTKMMAMITMIMRSVAKLLKSAQRETLEMLDKLVNLKDLTKEERNSLVAMKDKLEIITIQNRNQSRIYYFFVC